MSAARCTLVLVADQLNPRSGAFAVGDERNVACNEIAAQTLPTCFETWELVCTVLNVRHWGRGLLVAWQDTFSAAPTFIDSHPGDNAVVRTCQRFAHSRAEHAAPARLELQGVRNFNAARRIGESALRILATIRALRVWLGFRFDPANSVAIFESSGADMCDIRTDEAKAIERRARSRINGWAT